MKAIVQLLCLALLFAGTSAFAQLSKQEKKEWKKKAKEYAKNPANLKQFTEEKQSAENQVSTLNKKITEMQGAMSSKDARIAELEDQLSQLRGQLAQAQGVEATGPFATARSSHAPLQ